MPLWLVQIPSTPLPAAAVEPACGLVRLGSCSPLRAGAEACAGALAAAGVLAAGVLAAGALAAGALAADGDEALLDEGVADELESPPPPPPHATRTSEASRDNVNVAL